MKRPLFLTGVALCGGLVTTCVPGAAFAAETPLPAPTVTTSVDGERGILTITGEPGARATVHDSADRVVAGATLVDGTAEVVVPAPDMIKTTLGVSQQKGAAPASPEAEVIVGETSATEIASPKIEQLSASWTAAGTTAQFVVSGRPGATATVKDAAGKTLAVKALGKDGSAWVRLSGLGERATGVAVTQTIGLATAAPVEFSVVADPKSDPLRAADTGTLAYFDARSDLPGELLAVADDGSVVARTPFTKGPSWLAVPHAAGTTLAIKLVREVDGERSPGGNGTTLTEGAQAPALPAVERDPAHDTADRVALRLTDRSGLLGGHHTLAGSTIEVVDPTSKKVVTSFTAPDDLSGDGLGFAVPASAFTHDAYGDYVQVRQIFKGLASGDLEIDK